MALSVLAGCTYKTTTETKSAEISGCEIYRVELAGEMYPIFLAKCKDTATVTYSTGGKNNQTRSTVTMIQKETEGLAAKKKALEKLSDEEQKVLGLK